MDQQIKASNTRVTPELVTVLEADECFVFGSNLAGRHGMGAAKYAMEHFGAVYGVGSGPTGRCYAIPTKDGKLNQRSLHDIKDSIESFFIHARLNPATKFFVTKVGCGLAGYPTRVIGRLFTAGMVPHNVCLPLEFWHTATTIPMEVPAADA